MKRLLMTIALGLSTQVYANEQSCELETSIDSKDIKLMSVEDKQPLGYVSPNKDGSWFVWIEGVGASNQSFESSKAATDYLCSYKAEEKLRTR